MKCIGLVAASLACLCAVAESGEQTAAEGVCGVRYLRWHYTAIEGGPLDGKTDLIVKGGTVVMKRADLRGVSKIVVRSGATLKGTARYDESLVFEVEEGGVNKLRQDNGVLLILR